VNKIRWLCLTLIITFSLNAFGQIGIRKGIKGGYNWSTMTGDLFESTESLQEITAGFAVEFGLLGLFALQAEALYSPKGAQGTVFGNTEEYQLTYIACPVFIKKKFLPVLIHPYILAGTEFGFLVSAKHVDEDIKSHIRSQDTAFVLGGGIEFSFIGNSAYVEGRYTYGLDNVFKDIEEGDSKNRVTQVFFGILF